MNSQFDYGLERFLNDGLISGNVGLITNNTGRDRHGVHVAERIFRHPKLRLKAIFTPEHGFGSDAPDGDPVNSSVHPEFQIPIISLYGARKAPEPGDFSGLDLLVYDMQDVGVRFYTYISTLRNTLEAAARAGLPFHVLDRPDLLGGEIIEGPMLSPGFESFVGHLSIPLRYGLTPGELAIWLGNRLSPTFPPIIWECLNWRRGSAFEELGMPWVKPSPSMQNPDTARFYPGTCLFEGTNVSEGRGSDAPFQILGAPWVSPQAWLEALVPLLPSNVTATRAAFTPTFSKFQGGKCLGIKLQTSEKILADAVTVGLCALQSLLKSHPGQVEFPGRPSLSRPFFDYLAGNSWLREDLGKGATAKTLVSRGNAETAAFIAERKACLLY